MAGLIRSLFKSKKTRKEDKDETGNVEDYLVFQPCSRSSSFKRQPTTRFADDFLLPATAAYHTKNAPKLKKGPQSCPGGNREEEFQRKKSRDTREDFRIDDYPEGRRHYQSHRDLSRHQSLRQNHSKKRSSVYDFRSEDKSDDEENNENLGSFSDKIPHYYPENYRNSERRRREDRRQRDKFEDERNNIQSAAMANMAFYMASVQQMEQLKKERDQYKKEASRYKHRCEKLENRFEKMEMKASPNYAGMQPFLNPMQPSPYHTPQFPAPPLSFQYPMPSTRQAMPQPSFMNNPSARSADFLNHNTSHLPPPLHSFPYNSGGLMKNNHGGSTSFTTSNTPTTIGSEGAGESLANPSEISFLGNDKFKAPRNFDGGSSDEEEVKNFRNEAAYSRMSDLTQSTATTI